MAASVIASNRHMAVTAVKGLLDTDADISIMGPELFKKVAAITGIKKKQFKLRVADNLPNAYEHCTFHLDGWLDLDVTFVDKTMHAAIYLSLMIYALRCMSSAGHCEISSTSGC